MPQVLDYSTNESKIMPQVLDYSTNESKIEQKEENSLLEPLKDSKITYYPLLLSEKPFEI
jgi:hypothetical protein